MNRRFLPALLAALAALHAVLAAAGPVRTDEVEVELIAERTAFAPGENWVALRIRPQPGWHVYWRNPGDSGIPTALDWQLPDGVSAGEIHWPYPHPESLGELTNYGYSDETLHLVPIQVAAAAGPLTLQATATWLACKDVCIPGEAGLSLTLPLAGAGTPPPVDPDWAGAFAQAREQLPQPAADWPAQFAVTDSLVTLGITHALLDGADRVQFFPYASDLVNHAADQHSAQDGATLRLSQPLSPYFVDAPAQIEGVLVIERGGVNRAYEIAAEPGAVEAVAGAAAPARLPQLEAVEPAPRATGPAAAPPALALVLLFALLGGLILNLMPCVFPVLSLKALALVRSGGEVGGDARERRRQTYAYSAGVIASCVVVALAMLGLRGAGEAVGWGFQLQSPVFVGLIAYVIFALGLSLSGAAQFGLGLMNAGGALVQRPGLSGSFFTGVLAVVVASPCTAPFMGTALGYAMTQPAAISLLVFATLGLGLALPFLLIGWFPALARRLPRPGAWMETFKQFMAFPLYLTVVWLVWVVARQTDAQVAARLLMGLVAVAFALWLWHRRGPLAALLKLAALAGAVALLLTAPAPLPAAAAGPAADSTLGEPWSAARVAELRAQKRTIFVDFTADWCLSCKVNERVALRSARVQRAFLERNVATLVGDWTRSDPAITAELARFGRNGVPLYLVYRDGGEPRVLPQLLTPDIVIDAIE